MPDANDAAARNQRFREIMQARSKRVSDMSASEVEAAQARNVAFRAMAKELPKRAAANGAKRRVPRPPS